MENKEQTDAEAMAQWHDYMSRKVPQVIYPAPANLAECGKIVVAPAEDPNWWMAGFNDTESAQAFCEEYGLPFTIFDAHPDKDVQSPIIEKETIDFADQDYLGNFDSSNRQRGPRP